MKYTKDQTDALLERVERLVDKAPEFSAQDLVAMHEMLQAWRGWVALGRGAKWIITTLGLVAAAIASWAVLSKTLKEWLGS